MKPIYRAFDVANYFLFQAQRDQELLSNLKLQKLIYYAQGLHLTLYGSPLFKDKIKAWQYGPVVPELYLAYKKRGSGGIPPDPKFKPTTIDKNTREFLDEIYSVFGQFSAPRLLELTHTDDCWKEACPNKIISHQAMKAALKKYLKDEE